MHGNIRPILHGEAELVGTRLIVWDPKAGLEIYRSGFFGKPVGIPKPKPEQEFDVPLLLDLMEGLYLLEEGRITVVDSKTRRNVGRQVLLRRRVERTEASNSHTEFTGIFETRDS